MRGWNGPKTLSKEKAQTPTSLRDLETIEQSKVFERPAGADRQLDSVTDSVQAPLLIVLMMLVACLQRLMSIWSLRVAFVFVASIIVFLLFFLFLFVFIFFIFRLLSGNPVQLFREVGPFYIGFWMSFAHTKMLRLIPKRWRIHRARHPL